MPTECNDPKIVRSIDVGIVATSLGLATTIFALVDRLTPALSGVVDFRIRVVSGLVLTIATSIIALRILMKTHKCPGKVEGVWLLHYSYKRIWRRIALVVVACAVIGIALSVSSLRYIVGVTGPVEARVVGPNGIGISGVVVDAVNIDSKSVAESTTFTDSAGVFVLDLVRDNGRPATLFLKHGSCSRRVTFPKETLKQLENPDAKSTKVRSNIAIRLDCGFTP